MAQLIPLSLGDSFRGFRIVGTTPDYLAHYQAAAGAGRSSGPRRCRRCSARRWRAATGLKAGDRFIGATAWAAAAQRMARRPTRVTGVLAPCGCVLDRLILTATESVWQVHEDMHSGDAPLDDEDREGAGGRARGHDGADPLHARPLAAVTFPRYVNSSTGMQAAAPAVEITRLLRMVGVGTEVLRGFGAVLLLTAALSVFIALWNAVRERRADLAMLRMLGAPPGQGGARCCCARRCGWRCWPSALGLLAGHGLTALAGWLLQADKSLPVTGWHLGAGRRPGCRWRRWAWPLLAALLPAAQRLPGRCGPTC